MRITGTDEQKRIAKAAYMKKYWAKRKAAALNGVQTNPTNTQKPCRLNECPECGARFFVVAKG